VKPAARPRETDPRRALRTSSARPSSALLPFGSRLLDLAHLSHRILGRLPGALGVTRSGIMKSSADFLARRHRGMTHASLERLRSDRGGDIESLGRHRVAHGDLVDRYAARGATDPGRYRTMGFYDYLRHRDVLRDHIPRYDNCGNLAVVTEL